MDKFEKERMDITIELRSLHEQVKAGTVKAADAKAKLSELRSKKSEIEKKIALANKPVEIRTASSYEEVRKALIEKRAITLNGTGAINQIKELAKELMAKTPILNAVKYFYGANAQTNIPVLTPSVATPGNYAEGVTNVAADGQAQLVSKVITPYAYVSLLPVSAETLTLGSVNFETELPSIFADAFAQAFHNGILTGDGAGRNMKGLFVGVPTGNQIQCSAAGAPKVVDLVSLQSLISLQNNIINTVNIQFDEAKDTGDFT